MPPSSAIPQSAEAGSFRPCAATQGQKNHDDHCSGRHSAERQGHLDPGLVRQHAIDKSRIRFRSIITRSACSAVSAV
jgi:hypothetical protein